MSDEEDGANKSNSEEQEGKEEGEEEGDKEIEDEEEKETVSKEADKDIKGASSKKEKSKNNIPVRKPRSFYISKISELKAELESQKNLNKNNILEKEYEELKLDLNKKVTLLEKLKLTNEKQKNAIDELSKKIEQNNERKTIEENNNKIKLKKVIEMNPVLKEKDNKLNKATKQMKSLRLKNEGLMKLLYGDNEYNERVDLEDINKEIKEKLDQKNDEINSLTKQLKSHLKCKDEQTKLKKELNNLKNELKNIKTDIQTIKDKTEILILDKNDNNKLRNINNLLNPGNMPKKKLIIVNKSTPNIHSNKNKITNKKNAKKIILPLIVPLNYPKEYTILTEEFSLKIKESCMNNKIDYNILIDKIKMLESKKKNLEKKNKDELDEINIKVSNLDEKYKLMNIDKKGLNFNNNILKNKLSSLNHENNKQLKVVYKLEKELKEKQDISNTKNNEISVLLEKINAIRNLASFTKEIEVQESEINKYINQIKKERDIMEVDEDNKNNKNNEINDDLRIKFNKIENEESIQNEVINTQTNKVKKVKKNNKKK